MVTLSQSGAEPLEFGLFENSVPAFATGVAPTIPAEEFLCGVAQWPSAALEPRNPNPQSAANLLVVTANSLVDGFSDQQVEVTWFSSRKRFPSPKTIQPKIFRGSKTDREA